MSEDSEQSDSPLKVPEPPPPADIGVKTVSTESIETSSKSIFFTDSIDKK